MKNEDESTQINKYISSSGYCSRREADDYLAQGRVTINNQEATPTTKVYAGDMVAVDGERIKHKVVKSNIYIAFHKPKGITSTTDPEDKSNIINYIRHPRRIFPIGRLDKDSEGLILLTSDGDIVNKILRAGNDHDKEYVVEVNKPLTPDFVKKMSNGIIILGEKTKPCDVKQMGGKKFKIILTQGLNRQIRRMCEVLDYNVVSLKRTRIMNISISGIEVGKWRNLSNTEVENLNQQLVYSSKTEDASKSKKVWVPEKEFRQANLAQREKKDAKKVEKKINLRPSKNPDRGVGANQNVSTSKLKKLQSQGQSMGGNATKKAVTKSVRKPTVAVESAPKSKKASRYKDYLKAKKATNNVNLSVTPEQDMEPKQMEKNKDSHFAANVPKEKAFHRYKDYSAAGKSKRKSKD